jgi:D-3-phosphoglycerate dehydrogenase
MRTLFINAPVFSRAPAVAAALERRGWRMEPLLDKRAAGGRLTPALLSRALMRRAPELEQYISTYTPMSREFFEQAPKLKFVAMFGTGVDHIDLAAATDHGVLVVNTPGANARSVAELALGLMLSVARCIPAMHRGVCAGAWERYPGGELHGKTLGLAGMGHTARETARLAGCFGMELLAWARHPDQALARSLGVRMVGLDELLAASDYLSLHIPGGDKPFLGAAEIGRMKKGAVLINTARGSLVDLEALYEALHSGALAGAGLDVFPEEPSDGGHPIFRLRTLVATPHAGALTPEAQERTSLACLEELSLFMDKKRSAHACNPEVYAALGFS